MIEWVRLPLPDSRRRDYQSKDERWWILHPSASTAKRWELWDYKDGTKWCGDHPTLRAAKLSAQVRENQEKILGQP